MDLNHYPLPKKKTEVTHFENHGEYEKMADGSARMNNFNTPPQSDFNTPEMQGSMQKILSENIGEYVVIEFLIGTERLMRKQGILYFVGTSFVTLYDEQINNFIVCDIFSIKFVYFFFPGQRPRTNYNILNNPQNGNNSMTQKNNR